MVSNGEKFLPKRIFNLDYGAFGSGKSANYKQLIKQVHAETGKRARVLLADGSLPSYEGLIDSGLVEVLEFSHRAWPTKVLTKLCDGFFPEHADDPESPLLAPTKEKFKDIGITLVEGIATAGNYLMGHVRGGYAQMAAEGTKIGPDPAIRIAQGEWDNKKGQFADDGEWFGSSGAAHYGQAQSILVNCINRTKALPCHVCWSTHEMVAEQEVNVGDLKNPQKVRVGDMIIGPEVAGKAMTFTISRIMGHTLHHTKVMRVENTPTLDEHSKQRVKELDVEYRIYTRDHYNANGIVPVRYLALTRNVPPSFPHYFSSENPGDALMEFFRALKELRIKDGQ